MNGTFLFADLAGFTALTEAMGDHEAADVVADFGGAVRELLEDHQAREVKAIGDALMLHARAPERAVELGLRIVEDVGSRHHFPVVRVGMHTGAAVQRAGDWFGAAVNLAARVSAAAGGSEVLLTSATRRAAGTLTGIELHPRGRRSFKNVAEPVEIYAANRSGAQTDAGLPIDPVCRMAVDPDNAAGRLVHNGVEYHFCSLACANAFSGDPQRYSSAVTGPPHA